MVGDGHFPGFSRWMYWRWLPTCAFIRQPFFRRMRSTSANLTTNIIRTMRIIESSEIKNKKTASDPDLC